MQDKCAVKIERLSQVGHQLRRPEADLLRDGIYELRISLQGLHYRILYFFHSNKAAVLANGIIKTRRVPPKEMDLAMKRKEKFIQKPQKHTYKED